MKKLSILFLTLLALATACQKAEAPTLGIGNANLTVNAPGGAVSFQVISNTDWTLSYTAAPWFQLSTASGSGNATVTIQVEAYKDAGARSAEFIVKAGELSQVVTLVQNAPAAPSEVTNTVLKVPAMGGTYTVGIPTGFNVVTRVQWPELLTIDSVEDGEISFTVAANPYKADAVDAANKVAVFMSDGATPLVTIDILQSWRNVEPGELLIEEVYFTGSLIEGTNNSSDDQYIRLTNNADHVVYADRVLFVTNYVSGFITSAGAYYEYPELPDGIVVTDMYLIPGDGDDYPLQPGESAILAIHALDFREGNPGAFDLSKADFEFYGSDNENFPDTDNPDVPNLENWFKSSFSYTFLHKRGYESYAIVTPPLGESAESIMAAHHWTGTYYMHFNEWNFDFDIADDDAFVIPAEWVLDAVNCTTPDAFYQNPFGPAFDAGWTYAGDFDGDASRFGKSVRRKSENGKLADTNNSTNDFIPNATPTLR